MAEESEGANVNIGVNVEVDEAHAALGSLAKDMRTIANEMRETKMKADQLNDSIREGSDWGKKFAEEIESVGRGMLAAFSLDKIKDFIVEAKNLNEELAKNAGAEKQTAAAALASTGDINNPRTMAAFQTAVSDIKESPNLHVPYKEEELWGMLGELRRGLPGDKGAVDTYKILEEVQIRGQYMNQEQRATIAKQMMGRTRATGDLGDVHGAFDKAFRASTSAITPSDVDAAMGAAMGGATLSSAQAGDLYDTFSALGVSVANSGGNNRSITAILDAVSRARTQTVSGPGGRKSLAAPEFAAALDRDPAAAVRDFIGGKFDAEAETLITSEAAARSLAAARKDFGRIYNDISRGGRVDTITEARNVLGPQADILQSQLRMQRKDEENQGVALVRKSERDRLRADVYTMLGGGWKGSVGSGVMGFLDFATGGADPSLERMQRRAMAPDGGGASQNMNVNVTVSAPSGIDARMDLGN